MKSIQFILLGLVMAIAVGCSSSSSSSSQPTREEWMRETPAIVIVAFNRDHPKSTIRWIHKHTEDDGYTVHYITEDDPMIDRDVVYDGHGMLRSMHY